MKEDMFLSNLGTVAFHAAKVPTNVFSSTLICLITLDDSGCINLGVLCALYMPEAGAALRRHFNCKIIIM